MNIFNRIQPIRDNLLSCLKPEDINNLCVATDSELTYIERIKYMTIVRLLPLNLASLQKVISEQGEVYIISQHIKQLNNILNSYIKLNKDIKNLASVLIIILDKVKESIEISDKETIGHNPLQHLKYINSYKNEWLCTDTFTFANKTQTDDTNRFNKDNKLNTSGLLNVGNIYLEKKTNMHIVRSECVCLCKDSITTHDANYSVYNSDDDKRLYYATAFDKNIFISAGLQNIMLRTI